ncbi:F-box/LRR-repeat protein At4g14103-like [Coffea eugenioides]|uniref:F-box/LRR-repeat protein At4g14103-like n=1 Tax=Coffea eugenioides TaxID=49369 RepID=UPI000F6088A9|nr:F-box/LRR-repeat protein At4g14103-like [Coffea eugenioides]
METSNSISATIEDLPESILLHILSFLPTTTAVQTSAVAPKWRNLWHSIPVLHFNIRKFHSCVPDRSAAAARQFFAELISQTLLRRPRHSPLRKFRLKFDYRNYDSIRSYVNSWIRYAVSSRAVELDLTFGLYLSVKAEEDDDGETSADYCFDFSDLINSSVKVLKLRGCKFSLPRSRAFPIKIESLTALYLFGFDFGFVSMDMDVSKLVSLCVNLEFLCIEDVSGLNNLKIVSPKLKELKLSISRQTTLWDKSVEIFAPSLQSISFIWFYMGNYVLKDVSSLIEAHVEFDSREELEDFACWSNLVSLLSGVENLTVQNMWMSRFTQMAELASDNFEEVNKMLEVQFDAESEDNQEELHGKLLVEEEIFSETFAFNNLRHLVLLTGYTEYDLLGLEAVLKACSMLESMVLEYSYETDFDDILGEEIMERPIVMHMPSLRLVKMEKYRGVKNEVYVVGLLKKYGLVLEKIVAYPAKVGETLSPPFVL